MTTTYPYPLKVDCPLCKQELKAQVGIDLTNPEGIDKKDDSPNFMVEMKIVNVSVQHRCGKGATVHRGFMEERDG